jgi:hypothetical protein
MAEALNASRIWDQLLFCLVMTRSAIKQGVRRLVHKLKLSDSFETVLADLDRYGPATFRSDQRVTEPRFR